MSKPWDNDPTPLADIISTVEGAIFRIPAKEFRDLERRMRAAERLLDHALEHCGRSFTAQNIKAHLEAARKEDGQ